MRNGLLEKMEVIRCGLLATFLLTQRSSLALQFLQLAFQRLILIELSFQESARHNCFFLHAFGCQEIEVRPLVGTVTKIVGFNETFLNQCLKAEVHATETDTQFISDLPLARMRVCLEQLEDAIASFVSEHGNAAVLMFRE